MNILVDTLDYSRDLEKAGMERAHAEAIARLQARAISELVEHELVTKEFLRSELVQLETKLRDEMRSNASAARDDLRSEAATLRREVDTLMLQIRALQFGGAIAAFAISIIVLLSRFIR